MLTIATLLLLAPQAVPDRQPAAAEDTVRVALTPREPADGESLRWSPKGAKVALTPDGDALTGEFTLAGERRGVRLERSDDSERYDRLWVDLDADGRVGADETKTCAPRELRSKWWSSFEATLRIAVPGDDDAEGTTRPYPLALWYVFDPVEPDAKPLLRFSRRGWHQGEVQIDGAPATVLITESEMDGRFDRDDAWRIARDPKDTRNSGARGLERHDWLDGQAWRVAELDPHGRFVTIAKFDPGVTEAEEKAAVAARGAADRDAPRAEAPLAFRHDVDVALAEAKAKNQRIFLDFETTWCGPCKQMDAVVYPSKAVVDAAAGLICVKVDGDERRDLVKRFDVQAYPTLLIVAPDGSVAKRAVGYQSVAKTAAFLKDRESP